MSKCTLHMLRDMYLMATEYPQPGLCQTVQAIKLPFTISFGNNISFNYFYREENVQQAELGIQKKKI